MDRVILHSDCNAFYASVELLYHPELRGKPVAVAGDTEQRHGIILAKSQEAKKFGVSTGEVIWQAKQKCRDLITIPAHYDLYMQFSQAMHNIYARYTDQIEPFGLDECWLDVSGSTGLFGDGEHIANELRAIAKRELGITLSVGVSWNKIFAKLGSDYKKPDATTVITRENYQRIVYPLPASDLLYVGHATARKLAWIGIRTIGQIAQADVNYLCDHFGKWGEYLWCFASGHDVSPVLKEGHESPIKSISNSMTTYRDIESYDEAWQVCLGMSESVCRQLRKNGFYARTVKMSVRDTNLFWLERQAKLQTPACTVQAIAEGAMKLLREHYNFAAPLRSLGVRASDLVDSATGYQLCFFGNANKLARLERLESAVDELRIRFGNNAVVRARLVNADIIGESDPLTHDVHPVGFLGR